MDPMGRMVALLAVLAVTCIATGQKAADWDAQARELERAIRAGAPLPFDGVVRFIEIAPDSHLDKGRGLFDKLIEKYFADCSKLYDAMRDLPEGPEMQALSEKAKKMQLAADGHKELLRVNRALALQIVRNLAQAKPDKRGALIKQYAYEARPDLPVEVDRIFFGPWCGTYDDTNEERIAWTARRYPQDCIRVLASGKWDGRHYLIRCLESTDPALMPILIDLAADANTLVRGEAILALARFPVPGSNQAVLESLASPYHDTQAKAFYAATKLKIEAALPFAEAMLAEDPREKRRLALDPYVSEFLAGLATPAARGLLVRQVATSVAQNQLKALEAVLDSKCVEAVPVLERLLEDPETKERAGVFGALLALQPALARERVAAALSGKDRQLVFLAFEQVVKLKLREALPILESLLGSPDSDVRIRAAQAIESIKKPPE